MPGSVSEWFDQFVPQPSGVSLPAPDQDGHGAIRYRVLTASNGTLALPSPRLIQNYDS